MMRRPCTPARTRSHSPQAEEAGGVGGSKEAQHSPGMRNFHNTETEKEGSSQL